MTDLATLGLQIDSRQVPQAVGELDKLTAAGARAEGEMKGLGGASTAAGSQVRSASAAAADYAANAQRMAANTRLTGGIVSDLGKASSLSRIQMLELGHVATSLTDSLAAGMNPARALFMEMGRLGQVASYSEGGILGLSRALLGILAPFAAVLVPAGLLAAAFLNIKQNAASDEQMKQFAANLGLTHAEMKKLKDVSVTWGDTMKATLDVLLEKAGGSASGIKAWFSDAFDKIAEFGRFSVAVIAAAFVASFKLIVNVWSQLPGMISEAAVGAANLAIAAFEKMVNVGIAGLNKVGGAINSIFGTNIGALGDVTFKRLENGASGTSKRIAAQMKADFYSTFTSVNKTFDDISARATKNAQDRIKKQATDILADRTPKKGRSPGEDHSGEALAREMEATEALIRGNYALAAAYQVSDAAALKQEITTKATTEAIKKKADVATYVAQQMRLAISQGAADAAKEGAQLRAQADSQRAVNDAISAGTVPASAASQLMRDEAQLRPFLVKYAIAEGAEKVRLGQAISFLRTQQAAANEEANRAQVLAATANSSDQLDRIRLEATLIGQTNAVRAVAIAQLEAEQFLTAHPGASADEAQRYIDGQKAIAQGTADLSTAQDNYNHSLSYTAELLGLIHDQAQTTGQGLADAFGSVGQGVSTALTAITGYAATQAKLDQDHRAALKAAGADTAAQAKIDVLYAKQSATARSQATMQTIVGLKSLFKEHSTGYKIMTAIEKAYAAFQAVETIASIVRDTTKTASSVANSGIRATADGVAAIAKAIASLPFPLNIAAGAATAAALVAFGVKIFGGGGGGSAAAAPPTAEDVQAGNGAGSVLGDSKAKSDSIAHSLELVAANTNKDLEYSNNMLKALHSIDTSIAKLAGTVAQQIQVSGSVFDTSKLNLGTSGSGGFLGIGKKTDTRTLWDLGLNLAAGSVASIIANGISGSSYQTVQQVHTKSGFLGIGGGTKTTYQTTNGAIDPAITSAIQDVVTSLRDGLVAGAKVIGLSGAQAILDSFQVNIGKISYKEMTGDQIESQLNAIFSKVGDQMATALLPSLASMQKVGEGLFETFMRVAREYEVVDVELQSIGKTFGMVGVSSIGARDALVQLFGSMDAFVEQTDYFKEHFLSAAEQIAPVQAAVTAELTRLGKSGITTRDQFKQAVLGLDLTTDAGRQMYASLLAVAPAFDKVISYFDDANKATISGLKSTADQFNGFVTSLTKYRATLFAADAATGNAYETLRKQFLATSALAAGGDATALGGLEASGKAFLDASKNNASTLQDYQRDIAMVAQGVDKGIFAAESTADYAQLQLDALTNATSILQTISTNTAATATALTQPAAAPAQTGSQTVPSGETATIIDQNKTMIDQNTRMLEYMRQQGLLWSRFEGDGLTVKTDADTPLQTQAV